jgi:hypothetical protein
MRLDANQSFSKFFGLFLRLILSFLELIVFITSSNCLMGIHHPNLSWSCCRCHTTAELHFLPCVDLPCKQNQSWSSQRQHRPWIMPCMLSLVRDLFELMPMVISIWRSSLVNFNIDFLLIPSWWTTLMQTVQLFLVRTGRIYSDPINLYSHYPSSSQSRSAPTPDERNAPS